MRLVIISLFMVLTVYSSLAAQSYKTVCFSRVCVNAEVADTFDQRARGLMFRDRLQEKQAMLFVFPEQDYHSFWMKNTLIPLDIIWLDSDRKVVYIKKNAFVCKEENCESYTPDKKAKYVLEVNSGFSDKYRIHIGDTAGIRP